MARKIGILNSGGDCPGLNAVIASVVKAGTPLGYEFIGFERGWEGLLNPLMYRTLTVDDVRGISHLGGTIIRTTNKGRFSGKTGLGSHSNIPEIILAEAKTNLDSLGVEGLIVIGGDGTLSAARQLADYGVNIVGVPKSIDNDLDATDKTFGFSTAVSIVVDALDKIHTTAASHDRTFIVECMGRNTGWIAMSAGLAGGANAILMPEFDFSIEDLIEHVRDRRYHHLRASIILVAEGARITERKTHIEAAGEQEVRFIGTSEILMNEIEARAPDEFELRNVVLGHTQRGGSPNAEDRTLSKRYGVAAIEAYDKGEFGSMICIVKGSVQTCSLEDATSKLKAVNEDHYEYHVARSLGIFMHS